MVIWKVKIHRLVISEDFKSIAHSEQKIIINNIHKKLSIGPFEYGKPLGGELKGYWRLRIGDYRAIYKIRKDIIEVLVVKVGIRKDSEMYKKMLPRLKKLQE